MGNIGEIIEINEAESNSHISVWSLAGEGLTLTTLKYVCINHGDQRVFINLKLSKRSYSAVSALFECLCYWSKSILHFFILSVLGVYRRHILTSIDVIF